MTKQKGSVQVIVIIILVVLVAVAGYFYFAKSKQTSSPFETSQEVNNQETSNNTNPTASDTNKPAPTPSYATYTSPDGKISFQYRSDVFIAERSGKSDVLKYKKDPDGMAFTIISFLPTYSEFQSSSTYICGKNVITEGSISAGKTRTCTDESSKGVYSFIQISDDKTLSVYSYPTNSLELELHNQVLESIIVQK